MDVTINTETLMDLIISCTWYDSGVWVVDYEDFIVSVANDLSSLNPEFSKEDFINRCNSLRRH